MAEKWCEATKEKCDPRNCNREFCRWRDTVWILGQLGSWAYSTEEIKPVQPQKNDPESEQASQK